MRPTAKRIALLTIVLTATSFAAEFPPPALQMPLAPVGADQAAEIARVQTGGRILDVRPAATSGQSTYEVRVLLNEGRVRRVVVDVDSGAMQ